MAADDWPRHDNKAWQAVLDRIRVLGWPRPEWTSNHPTLVMDCPASAPQCRIRAFSTGKGTESVAKQALRKVDRCPHRKITAELTLVDEHLASAERLIKGAATLVQRGDLDQRIDELLALATESIQSAEQALIDQEFDDVTAERDAMDHAHPHVPDDSSPESHLSSADAPLRQARLHLRDLPEKNEDVRVRHDRLNDLTSQRDSLRDALHEDPRP